jgi:Fanconi-associated nuclease 1
MDLDQLEHELEEEREQRKNQNQDRLSYYQQSILEILKAVQEGYSNILVEEEQRLLKDIKQLSGDAQRLFFRLYLRRATWFRVTKLDYKDVSDCDDAVSVLERAGLVECNVTEPEEILKILQLDEIKTMAKGFQVKGRNKGELVSALLATQKSRQTRLNFSTGIQRESIAQEASVRLLKEAKRLTGKIIRIPMVVADPLKRIIGLFFLRTSHLEEEADQLNTAILTDLNRRKYPPYLICRSAPVFASRRDWLEYEEALMYERTIAEVLSEGEITLDFVVDMLKTAKSNWTQHHPNGVTIKSYFLRRYSAGWAYTRALSSLAAVMEKLKAFKEANEIIEMLLCQDLYCVGQRGRWWERIVLNLDAHLGDKTEALGKCRQALTDEYVRTGSRLAIRRRLLKLLKYHDEKIKEEDAILDVEPEVITLYADPEDSRVTGRKLCFLLSGGVPGSVEAFALEHFKEQGWCGFHCESSIFRTLWTLCFWEILYGDAPDVFQTPYQTAPLDLKTDAFFQDRQEKILCRLEEVKQGLAPQLIVDAYYPFYGCQALGVSWNEYPLNALLDICHSLSGDVLAPIFRLLAEDYAGSFAGLPDLLLYRPDRSDYLLVEVKSTNDRLSDAQRNWNVVFRQHGIKSVMCRVLDTTAIDHRPKKSKTVNIEKEI